MRLRRAVDLLERLAAGESAAPDDGTGGAGEEAAGPKKRARRAAPTVSPLTMASVQGRATVQGRRALFHRRLPRRPTLANLLFDASADGHRN